MARSLLLLSFIMDEEVSIVHRFGQRAMWLPKLCKMEPRGGQDQLGIPDLLIFVSVTSIKIRTFTRARLCVGQEPDGFGPGIIRGPRQQLLYEGGHGNDRGVLPRSIVHLVPTWRKESSEKRNALCLAGPIDPSHDELCFVREEREQDANC